jgi:hypothetical protein
MVTGIIALLGTVAAILFWFLKRYGARQDDPLVHQQKRYEEIDKELVKRDSQAASAALDDDLNKLSALSGNKPGPDSDPTNDRTAFHSKH